MGPDALPGNGSLNPLGNTGETLFPQRGPSLGSPPSVQKGERGLQHNAEAPSRDPPLWSLPAPRFFPRPRNPGDPVFNPTSKRRFSPPAPSKGHQGPQVLSRPPARKDPITGTPPLTPMVPGRFLPQDSPGNPIAPCVPGNLQMELILHPGRPQFALGAPPILWAHPTFPFWVPIAGARSAPTGLQNWKPANSPRGREIFRPNENPQGSPLGRPLGWDPGPLKETPPGSRGSSKLGTLGRVQGNRANLPKANLPQRGRQAEPSKFPQPPAKLNLAPPNPVEGPKVGFRQLPDIMAYVNHDLTISARGHGAGTGPSCTHPGYSGHGFTQQDRCHGPGSCSYQP